MLPHSDDAEQALLGAVLIDNSVLDVVIPYLPEKEVFFGSEAQTIWDAMLRIKERGTVIDVVSVLEEIPESRSKTIKAYELTGYIDTVPSVSQAEGYAKIVYNKWLLRQAIIQAEKIRSLSDQSSTEANKVVEKVHNVTTELIHMRPTRTFDIGKLLDKTVDKMMDADNIIPFGIGQMDQITGGMTRGEITVLAGRPSHGKSTVMINLVKNLVHKGYKVMVFNREMTNSEMVKKLMVLESGQLSYRDLRMQIISEDDYEELQRMKKLIQETYDGKLKMYDDFRHLHEGSNEVTKFQPDVVVDDYIQIVRSRDSGYDQPRFQIMEIMEHYKWLAKSGNMSVMLLSQLNREVEKRPSKRPVLSDLSESNAIERDAETVIFLYYAWKYYYQHHERGELGKYELEMLFEKTRYAETGNAKVGFYGDHCKVLETPDSAVALAQDLGEIT